MRKKVPYRVSSARHRARSLNSAARSADEMGLNFRGAIPLVTELLPPVPTPRLRLIEGGSAYRKAFPLCTGLLDYFPDALAGVAEVSFVGNMKHNPGEPMHHARGKSMDHADCILRHLSERGGFDVVVVDGVEYRIRHSLALAWRALALAQEELEAELHLPLPRGAGA